VTTSEASRGSGAVERRFVGHAPLPAIPSVGALTAADAAAARWTLILVWFMRTLAVVWIFKGLFNWTIMLGVDPQVANILTMPGSLAATICFFAVADLVAAVGLWLAAPWGGVLWLLCAATEALAPILNERDFSGVGMAVALNAGLIVVYFALNVMAARERG
jgi:Family of unknown function (DUF6163)